MLYFNVCIDIWYQPPLNSTLWVTNQRANFRNDVEYNSPPRQNKSVWSMKILLDDVIVAMICTDLWRLSEMYHRKTELANWSHVLVADGCWISAVSCFGFYSPNRHTFKCRRLNVIQIGRIGKIITSPVHRSMYHTNSERTESIWGVKTGWNRTHRSSQRFLMMLETHKVNFHWRSGEIRFRVVCHTRIFFVEINWQEAALLRLNDHWACKIYHRGSLWVYILICMRLP